jgi:hypothetical protein
MDDGESIFVELDPPFCLKLDFNTFEALFELARGRRKPPRTARAPHEARKTAPAGKTVWDLIQEALREKPRGSAELMKYVASKGKLSSEFTVRSILQLKRKAGLVDSTDERGGAWQLTGGKS